LRSKPLATSSILFKQHSFLVALFIYLLLLFLNEALSSFQKQLLEGEATQKKNVSEDAVKLGEDAAVVSR